MFGSDDMGALSAMADIMSTSVSYTGRYQLTRNPQPHKSTRCRSEQSQFEARTGTVMRVVMATRLEVAEMPLGRRTSHRRSLWSMCRRKQAQSRRELSVLCPSTGSFASCWESGGAPTFLSACSRIAAARPHEQADKNVGAPPNDSPPEYA